MFASPGSGITLRFLAPVCFLARFCNLFGLQSAQMCMAASVVESAASSVAQGGWTHDLVPVKRSLQQFLSCRGICVLLSSKNLARYIDSVPDARSCRESSCFEIGSVCSESSTCPTDPVWERLKPKISPELLCSPCIRVMRLACCANTVPVVVCSQPGQCDSVWTILCVRVHAAERRMLNICPIHHLGVCVVCCI